MILRSRRVVFPDGERPASLVLARGKIAAIEPYDAKLKGAAEDFGAKAILPGLVDTHVHVNEPGRTEWEGFETATRAAAAGGITTIVDMPLNSDPVTTTVGALRLKREAAKPQLAVDCAFWGGVVPGNLDELGPMIDEGVRGFKCFLVHSGIDDFPHVEEAELRAAMELLARAKLPLLVHAELDCGAATSGDPRAYSTYLASRPQKWENEAVKLVARLARETGCRAHIVHLSSAEALPLIADARRKGAKLTVETCPHYLSFAADEIPHGRTEFKCSPPIRERSNRDRLWAAVKSGEIDFIVSDHSPCLPALKKPELGDFMAAWGGISSLQFALSAVWTEASRRGLTLPDIARLMSERPAAFAGLKGKGRIEPGADADLAVFDPAAELTVSPESIRHRHRVTPYAGRALRGVVAASYLRGRKIGALPLGRLL